MRITLLCLLALAACGRDDFYVEEVGAVETEAVTSASYYVATNGNDANPGTLASPLRSIPKAVDLVRAGGSVIIRGGTYALSSALTLSRSGTSSGKIYLQNYGTEVVTLNFASNPRNTNPPQPRVDDSLAATRAANGITVTGNWWHIRGISIRNAAYYGVRVYGSHTTVERVDVGNSKAAGFEITGKDNYEPSYNLIINCDSHDNFDPQGNGEDADGFGVKFDGIGPGNSLRSNRAWKNSDDGYDFWHAVEVVTISDCWSFENGFNRPEWQSQLTGSFAGDGFGFKLGQEASALQLTRVVAWGNKGFGIDDNGNNSSGVIIDHATLFANAKDGNPIQVSLNEGSAHTITNSVAFDTDAAFNASSAIEKTANVSDAFNSWTLPVSVSATDFVNANLTTLSTEGSAPRAANGALPLIGLRLRTGSDLVNKGTPTASPYKGAHPDLGAFELQ
jgi:hypothetical protein